MNPDDPAWELIGTYLGGSASPEQTRQLEALMLNDPKLRTAFLRYARMDAALAGQTPSAAGQPLLSETPWEDTPKIRSARLRLSPVAAAAAAGVVFGMFCSSMVLAYVAPVASKALGLLWESFETGPAPLAEGVPNEASRWGGDDSELVGMQQGVKPSTGTRMLRLRRPDFAGKPPAASVRADMYRVVDLRAHRQEIGHGEAMVQLSALFNHGVSGEALGSDGLITLYALPNARAFTGLVPDDSRLSLGAVAMVRKSIARLDDQPQTWEKLQAELRLPAETQFLVIHLGMKPLPPLATGSEFDGLYVDDVRLTLGRRAALP